MLRRGEFVLAALLAWSLIAHRSSASAQARDLESPRGQATPAAPLVQQDEFGDSDAAPRRAPVQPRDVTAPRLPPSNSEPVYVANPGSAYGRAPGRVLVRFSGDNHRNFVVTTLLGTSRATARFGLNMATAEAESHALLCRLSCDAWLDPGAYRFGLGHSAYPDYQSPIIQINGPTLITVEYSDRALVRGIGGLALLLGIGLGALGVWALIENEPDFAIAGAIAGGIVILTGLGMVFTSDGVRFQWAGLPQQ